MSSYLRSCRRAFAFKCSMQDSITKEIAQQKKWSATDAGKVRIETWCEELVKKLQEFAAVTKMDSSTKETILSALLSCSNDRQ